MTTPVDKKQVYSVSKHIFFEEVQQPKKLPKKSDLDKCANLHEEKSYKGVTLGLSDVAKPACNRVFRRHPVLASPPTYLCHLPASLSDDSYCHCSCCERVDCLVYVTGEAKSKDPAFNSHMSLNSSTSWPEGPRDDRARR